MEVKRVLVAVDCSTHARHVMHYAMVRENAEKDMAEFLLECQLCDDLDLTVMPETGEPAVAILRVVERENCQLAVVGAQGNTSLLHQLILGSVTSKVARLSPVPVITAPVSAAPLHPPKEAPSHSGSKGSPAGSRRS